MNQKKIKLQKLVIFIIVLIIAFYIAYKPLKLNNEASIQKNTENASEALLSAPKHDGVYLVNHDIMMGKWISEEGFGDACYWVRRKYDAIVRGEYYGKSGVIMEIVEGDYEVEMRGCGVWNLIEE